MLLSLRESWIFCLRFGKRHAEWFYEAEPTKDGLLFLAGRVEVVVCRVCGGDVCCGGSRGAGFAPAGAGSAFGGGGLFCPVSCLCGSVFPEKQGGPLVLASCLRDDYGCRSVRARRGLISHLYIF